MGTLPLEIELVPGSYTVEAECGRQGLVHEVVVRMGSIRRVMVAPRLERALSLEPPLVLTPAAGLELRTEDSVATRGLALDCLALDAPTRWFALRVTRWRQNKAGLTKEGMSSEPLAPLATSEARLEAAVDRPLCGPECDRVRAGTSPETRAAGLLLAGVGTSAMLASWVAWQRYRELDTELDETRGRSGLRRDRVRPRRVGTVALVSTASGSALFAAGAPLWLPRRRRYRGGAGPRAPSAWRRLESAYLCGPATCAWNPRPVRRKMRPPASAPGRRSRSGRRWSARARARWRSRSLF